MRPLAPLLLAACLRLRPASGFLETARGTGEWLPGDAEATAFVGFRPDEAEYVGVEELLIWGRNDHPFGADLGWLVPASFSWRTAAFAPTGDRLIVGERISQRRAYLNMSEAATASALSTKQLLNNNNGSGGEPPLLLFERLARVSDGKLITGDPGEEEGKPSVPTTSQELSEWTWMAVTVSLEGLPGPADRWARMEACEPPPQDAELFTTPGAGTVRYSRESRIAYAYTMSTPTGLNDGGGPTQVFSGATVPCFGLRLTHFNGTEMARYFESAYNSSSASILRSGGSFDATDSAASGRWANVLAGSEERAVGESDGSGFKSGISGLSPTSTPLILFPGSYTPPPVTVIETVSPYTSPVATPSPGCVTDCVDRRAYYIGTVARTLPLSGTGPAGWFLQQPMLNHSDVLRGQASPNKGLWLSWSFRLGGDSHLNDILALPRRPDAYSIFYSPVLFMEQMLLPAIEAALGNESDPSFDTDDVEDGGSDLSFAFTAELRAASSQPEGWPTPLVLGRLPTRHMRMRRGKTLASSPEILNLRGGDTLSFYPTSRDRERMLSLDYSPTGRFSLVLHFLPAADGTADRLERLAFPTCRLPRFGRSGGNPFETRFPSYQGVYPARGGHPDDPIEEDDPAYLGMRGAYSVDGVQWAQLPEPVCVTLDFGMLRRSINSDTLIEPSLEGRTRSGTPRPSVAPAGNNNDLPHPGAVPSSSPNPDQGASLDVPQPRSPSPTSLPTPQGEGGGPQGPLCRTEEGGLLPCGVAGDLPFLDTSGNISAPIRRDRPLLPFRSVTVLISPFPDLVNPGPPGLLRLTSLTLPLAYPLTAFAPPALSARDALRVLVTVSLRTHRPAEAAPFYSHYARQLAAKRTVVTMGWPTTGRYYTVDLTGMDLVLPASYDLAARQVPLALTIEWSGHYSAPAPFLAACVGSTGSEGSAGFSPPNSTTPRWWWAVGNILASGDSLERTLAAAAAGAGGGGSGSGGDASGVGGGGGGDIYIEDTRYEVADVSAASANVCVRLGVRIEPAAPAEGSGTPSPSPSPPPLSATPSFTTAPLGQTWQEVRYVDYTQNLLRKALPPLLAEGVLLPLSPPPPPPPVEVTGGNSGGTRLWAHGEVRDAVGFGNASAVHRDTVVIAVAIPHGAFSRAVTSVSLPLAFGPGPVAQVGAPPAPGQPPALSLPSLPLSLVANVSVRSVVRKVDPAGSGVAPLGPGARGDAFFPTIDTHDFIPDVRGEHLPGSPYVTWNLPRPLVVGGGYSGHFAVVVSIALPREVHADRSLALRLLQCRLPRDSVFEVNLYPPGLVPLLPSQGHGVPLISDDGGETWVRTDFLPSVKDPGGVTASSSSTMAGKICYRVMGLYPQGGVPSASRTSPPSSSAAPSLSNTPTLSHSPGATRLPGPTPSPTPTNATGLQEGGSGLPGGGSGSGGGDSHSVIAGLAATLAVVTVGAAIFAGSAHWRRAGSGNLLMSAGGGSDNNNDGRSKQRASASGRPGSGQRRNGDSSNNPLRVVDVVPSFASSNGLAPAIGSPPASSGNGTGGGGSNRALTAMAGVAEATGSSSRGVAQAQRSQQGAMTRGGHVFGGGERAGVAYDDPA